MFGFGIIAENFKVFENDIFDCKVVWMVGKGEWKSVGFFVLYSLKCGLSVDFLGVPVVTAESG